MRIDGLHLAEKVVLSLEILAKREPKHITFVLFNNDLASAIFVKRKEALAKRLGVEVHTLIRSPETTEEAVSIVEELNYSDTNGIVIQLPLPKHIDTDRVLGVLDPELDIDVLGPEAIRRFETRESDRTPPVASAVEAILKEYKISLLGKKIVILGKGRLVGEPVGKLFERDGLTYDFIDITTSKADWMRLLKEADCVVSGVGVPHILMPEMLKEGVVLIDAGTSSENGKLEGDIDPSCGTIASFMTPVPGGVGPVTVATLFLNLFKN